MLMTGARLIGSGRGNLLLISSLCSKKLCAQGWREGRAEVSKLSRSDPIKSLKIGTIWKHIGAKNHDNKSPARVAAFAGPAHGGWQGRLPGTACRDVKVALTYRTPRTLLLPTRHRAPKGAVMASEPETLSCALVPHSPANSWARIQLWFCGYFRPLFLWLSQTVSDEE